MRVALVTGSSRGMGRATILRLANTHEALVVHYRRDGEAAHRVAEELEARGRTVLLARAELESEDDVGQLIDSIANSFGRLDTLVANAAAGKFSDMAKQSNSNVQRTLNTSVTSFVQLVRESSPLMNDGGAIVVVSGVDSMFATPLHGAIGAAKAALEALVRQYAVELGDRGIRVNAVVPGAIETDSSKYQFEQSAGLKDSLVQATPGRPLGSPDQVAAVIAFLCSEDASFISGASILVDGGLSAGGGPWGKIALDLARSESAGA